MNPTSHKDQPAKEEIVEELNTLIKESLKLVDGYQLAADRLDTSAYRETCRHFVDDYRKLVEELQKQVSALGESPARSSSIGSFMLNNTIRLNDFRGDHIILETMADTEAEVAQQLEQVRRRAQNQEVKETLSLGNAVATIHRDWLRREIALS